MSAATRRGLLVLTLALLLGLLADWLLRATPLGLGATLWSLVALAAVAGLARRAGRLRGALAFGLAGASVFLLCLSWRDSPILAELDVFAAAVCLSLVFVPRASVARAQLDELVHAGLLWLGTLAAGLVPVVRSDIAWTEVAHPDRRRHAAAVGRGVALAVPLLLVFGALFVTADAVFGDLLGGALPPPRHLGPHLVTIVAWGWIAAGLLRTATAHGPDAGAWERVPGRLGAVDGVALGLVDLLFLAFVVVQFRAFFGGRSFVVHHARLTYAEYARSGFFQLAAVAALAVGLLLALDWMLRREERAAEPLFRVLGAILVVLVFAVMASALERMRLYERTFGLTGLRFYTTAFMLWLAVVLVWLAATVLRGRRERFAVGVLLSGLATILALNAINPDAIIARVDVHLARHGRPVDYEYLGSLSDDATPTLVAAIPELQRRERGGTTFGPLGPQYDAPGSIAKLLGLRASCQADWRTWNRSRARARDLLCRAKS